MSVPPDTLFNRLLDFRETTIEDINRTLGKNLVQPAMRRGFSDSLPRRGTQASLGGMRGDSYPVTYVVRMLSGNTEDIRTIKTATRLIKRAAERFASIMDKTPNVVVVGFQSLQCGFNTWTTEFMKDGKSFLGPKWTQGMLEWVPENQRPTKVYFPPLSMIHSINKIPGWMRRHISVSRLEDNYMDMFGHKITPVFSKFYREGKEIVLIDDTLNTGTSIAFQARLLERFHIPRERIHLLALVNERGGSEE